MGCIVTVQRYTEFANVPSQKDQGLHSQYSSGNRKLGQGIPLITSYRGLVTGGPNSKNYLSCTRIASNNLFSLFLIRKGCEVH
jgi:hypothetical protein